MTKEDEYLEKAILLSIEKGKTNVGFLQQKLLIGYSRAARLIDMMEEKGIIGEMQEKSRYRKVLISKEDYLKSK